MAPAVGVDPPAADTEYSGDTLLVVTVIFIPIIMLCVALRYLSRYLVCGGWGLDDVLIFTSLILQLGMAVIAISASA